jgi:hypothetical protein
LNTVYFGGCDLADVGGGPNFTFLPESGALSGVGVNGCLDLLGMGGVPGRLTNLDRAVTVPSENVTDAFVGADGALASPSSSHGLGTFGTGGSVVPGTSETRIGLRSGAESFGAAISTPDGLAAGGGGPPDFTANLTDDGGFAGAGGGGGGAESDVAFSGGS